MQYNTKEKISQELKNIKQSIFYSHKIQQKKKPTTIK